MNTGISSSNRQLPREPRGDAPRQHPLVIIGKSAAGGAPPRNPRRLKQALVEPPFRMHNCRHYQNCLDDACEARWDSWCCTGCGAFEQAARPAVSNNRGHDFYY